MKKRWVVSIVGIAACASVDAVPGEGNGSPDAPGSSVDAASLSDSESDAACAEADPGACAELDYFPESCSEDILCPNGPFDPNSPGGSLDLRAQINVIRGRSISDVWAAGALGALAHFDGTAWSRSDPGERETLRALWLRDSAEIALGVLQRVYARGADIQEGGAAPSNGGWTVHSSSRPPEYTYAVGIALFVSGCATPGAEWLWCTTRTWAQTDSTSGLWRLRQQPGTAVEIGVGIPTSVCSSAGCRQMTSIHGSSADDLWAVGLGGVTFRITAAQSDTPNVKSFNSQTWNALNGVWAASASEAWAVGAMGTIRHYTGQPLLWDVVSDVPTTRDLNAVWGASSSDVWAVGDAGVVLHYDGKGWSRMKIAGLGPRRPSLTTVWSPAPGHVWIGGQGVILSVGGKP